MARTVAEICSQLGLEPAAVLARIAANDLECTNCRGTGFTNYALPAGKHRKDMSHGSHTPQCRKMLEDQGHFAKGARAGGAVARTNAAAKLQAACICKGIGTRPCQSCNQTGKEPITPQLMLDAGTKLLAKMEPDLKAIEHKGTIGINLAETLRSRYTERTK